MFYIKAERFFFVLFFSLKFQNRTPWRNEHNLIVPVLKEIMKERKEEKYM